VETGDYQSEDQCDWVNLSSSISHKNS